MDKFEFEKILTLVIKNEMDSKKFYEFAAGRLKDTGFKTILTRFGVR